MNYILAQEAGSGALLGAWESYLLPRQAKDRPPGKPGKPGKPRTVPQARNELFPRPAKEHPPVPKIMNFLHK